LDRYALECPEHAAQTSVTKQRCAAIPAGHATARGAPRREPYRPRSHRPPHRSVCAVPCNADPCHANVPASRGACDPCGRCAARCGARSRQHAWVPEDHASSSTYGLPPLLRSASPWDGTGTTWPVSRAWRTRVEAGRCGIRTARRALPPAVEGRYAPCADAVAPSTEAGPTLCRCCANALPSPVPSHHGASHHVPGGRQRALRGALTRTLLADGADMS
jgi:hypothetical protein